MKNRPLILIILGCLHFLEPLFKIFYFKAKTQFDLLTILNNLTTFSHDNMKGLVDFWLIFPLAGIALLSVKKWSYPLFISIQAYSVINYLTYEKFTWPYFTKVPLYSSFFLLVLNTFFIIYVSLPEVRQLFFNQKMRWWETRIRYSLKIPITLWQNNPEESERAYLNNISETGAFLVYNKEVDLGEYIHFNLTFLDQNLQIKGKVVRIQPHGVQRGIGIRFSYQTALSPNKFKVRSLIRAIKRFQKKNPSNLSNVLS